MIPLELEPGQRHFCFPGDVCPIISLSPAAAAPDYIFTGRRGRAVNELQLDLRTIARLGNDIDAYLEQLAQVTSWAENTINAKK